MLAPVENVIRIAWSVVAVYWLAKAARTKRTGRREPLLKRVVAYWLPLLAAGALLGPRDWYGDGFLQDRFMPAYASVQWLGAAITVAGAALACWARWWLGRNWSVSVQVKHDHELIRSGPYGVVRHPIYSGFLLGFLGTAVAIGEWRALVAVGILAASFVYKLRVEERFMRDQFGPAWSDYSARTRALVPGIY